MIEKTKDTHCETCEFWGSARSEPSGACRRHPPTIESCRWPHSYACEWCGEYQAQSRTETGGPTKGETPLAHDGILMRGVQV